MRGHEALIAMRRQRLAPNFVLIFCGVDSLRGWAEWPEASPQHAEIQIEPDEPLSALDLRCVVGLNVVVCGDDEKRVAAVYAKFLENEAKRVLSADQDSAKGVVA